MPSTRIGCSGWNYRHWSGLFYPAGLPASRWLEHYARTFDTVEVNAPSTAFPPALDEAGKLGPVLWQLPETFRRDDERLAAALDQLPPGRHCFEFRHPSWFVPEVELLLREPGVALVLGDHPRRRFQTLAPAAGWTYVRFHHGEARDGAYGEAALGTWAGRIRAWERSRDVYAYFNDDWNGHAVREAIRLRELVGVGSNRR